MASDQLPKRRKILRAIILKTASHHIPSVRHRLNTEPVPTQILERMRARDDLRFRYSTSPALQEMNDEIIPMPKPGKDSSLSTSFWPISLLCPESKGKDALLLPTVNNYLLPTADHNGVRPGHSTTSAFLQLTSDIAAGFTQRKPPHHTSCVAS